MRRLLVLSRLRVTPGSRPDIRLIETDVACGATALHWAATLGDEPAVGLLLAEGADVEARGCRI